MIELLQTIVIAGSLIIITFLVLLALPACKLRDMLMPFVAWGFVALCAAYALSPIDILPEAFLGPFGLIDDFGALVLGVGTAISTMNRRKIDHRN